MNRIFLSLIFVGILSSCGREHPLREEFYYFSEANAGWVNFDSLDDSFVMTDENDISHHFSLKSTDHYMEQTWGGFLVLTTYTNNKEFSIYGYQSNSGTGFSLSLRAAIEGRGAQLNIHLGETSFTYDLDLRNLRLIHTQFGRRDRLDPDEDNEGRDPLLSSCELLDTLTVSEILYADVLHLKLEDFKDQWGRYMVTEIFVAKNKGLIKYVMNNGLVTERVQN